MTINFNSMAKYLSNHHGVDVNNTTEADLRNWLTLERFPSTDIEAFIAQWYAKNVEAKKNHDFMKAVAQMVELGNKFLRDSISEYSRLNRYEDDDLRREIEDLRYNEISATANVIRLFTGREISFQWAKGANGEWNGGFALYEIMGDAPCYQRMAGTPTTEYSRYTGKQEPYRDVDWSKGLEQGKIVKIYELIYNKDAMPCYVGGYQTAEFQGA